MMSHALREDVFVTDSAIQRTSGDGLEARLAGRARDRGLLGRLRRRRAEQRFKRAQRGCAIAFADLWRAHARLVHAILISMVREEDAEDLMQEVALAAWTHLGSVRSADRFSAWLSTITRNAGRDALRARSTVEEESLPEEGIAAVDRAPDADEIADFVMTRIRRLPEAYREALTLRLVLGYGADEIAERTGMTPGSVRVNLCRGMRRLRKQLEDVTWLP